MKRWIHAASKADRRFYNVHFGWDEGGPESGPIFKSENVIVKARNEKDAENRVRNRFNGGLEGCWAELATQADIDEFVEEMKKSEEEYRSLVEAGLIDPELDAEMAEATDPDRFNKMSTHELKEYFHNFVEGAEFKTFTEWYNFLKETGSRGRKATASVEVHASEDDELDQWEEIAHKMVTDWDGFTTDYTLYYNAETGQYVTIYGDKDFYNPVNSDYDEEFYDIDDALAAFEYFDDLDD